MKSPRFITALATASLLINSQSLLAETQTPAIKPEQNAEQILPTPDYTGDLMDRSALLGDFGGPRQKLANDGVTLDADLTQVGQGVVSGGRDTGWEYLGRGTTTLNMDTAKMGLWPGGLITVMGEGNFGNYLTDNTGSLFGTNANDLFPERKNNFVMPQVTLTQFLSPEFGFVVGKIATVSETSGDMNSFAHGKGSRQFLNPAFNFNPVVALTAPYSTLGASAIYLPSKELIITTAVIDPHGAPGRDGFDTLFSNGVTMAAEARYTTHFFGKTGHQLLGYNYSTSSYTDLDQSTRNLIFPGLPTQQASNSWATFWNADQYFFQPSPEADRGVGVFARAGFTDGKANPVHHFASAGIGGKGMFCGRENDSFGVGYFYTWVANTRITNQLGFNDAQGLEAYYKFAITPALELSPDIQWIQASQDRVDDSWVTGVRLYTAF